MLLLFLKKKIFKNMNALAQKPGIHVIDRVMANEWSYDRAEHIDISPWHGGCRFIKRPYEKLSCPRISFVNSEDTRGEWTRWKCQGTKDFATRDTLVCFLLSESQLHTFTQETSMKSVQDTIHGKIIVSLF